MSKEQKCKVRARILEHVWNLNSRGLIGFQMVDKMAAIFFSFPFKNFWLDFIYKHNFYLYMLTYASPDITDFK